MNNEKVVETHHYASLPSNTISPRQNIYIPFPHDARTETNTYILLSHDARTKKNTYISFPHDAGTKIFLSLNK
jgi:anionic cell wall polymer biosynthesis LytR-Cps2A-Psr (LCP) family protein